MRTEYQSLRNKFRVLQTQRVFLKRPTELDQNDLLELRSSAWANCYVKREIPKNVQDILGFIDKINNGIDHGDIFYWIIVKKGRGEFVGTICLWNLSADKKTAEIGYELCEEYHGKGLMSESMRIVVEFAFRDLKIHRLMAYTHKENADSKVLLDKFGFRKDSRLQDPDIPENEIYILRS